MTHHTTLPSMLSISMHSPPAPSAAGLHQIGHRRVNFQGMGPAGRPTPAAIAAAAVVAITKDKHARGGDSNDDESILDHAQFPHIMDEIMRFAPPASLLRLRCASREYREKVDGLFAAHVVIDNNSMTPTTPTTPSGSGFLNVAPYMAPRFQPPLELTRTRIVDLVGPVGARTLSHTLSAGKTGHEMYLEYLASRMVNVDLVRLRPDAEGRGTSSCPLNTRSMVAFTQFSEPDSSAYPSMASVGPIPDSVERLVLNVSYEPRSWWLPCAALSVLDLAHHPTLSQLTVILTPRPSSRGCGRAFGECLGPPQWMGMMCSIVNLICFMLPRVQFTLVGVDKLEPEWLGIEPDWMGTPPSTSSSMWDYRKDTVVHLIQDAIAAELRRRHGYDFDQADEVLGNVRFLSRSRYECEISPRQFELETCQ